MHLAPNEAVYRFSYETNGINMTFPASSYAFALFVFIFLLLMFIFLLLLTKALTVIYISNYNQSQSLNTLSKPIINIEYQPIVDLHNNHWVGGGSHLHTRQGKGSHLHTRQGKVLAGVKGVADDCESEGSPRQNAGLTNRKCTGQLIPDRSPRR